MESVIKSLPKLSHAAVTRRIVVRHHNNTIVVDYDKGMIIAGQNAMIANEIMRFYVTHESSTINLYSKDDMLRVLIDMMNSLFLAENDRILCEMARAKVCTTYDSDIDNVIAYIKAFAPNLCAISCFAAIDNLSGRQFISKLFPDRVVCRVGDGTIFLNEHYLQKIEKLAARLRAIKTTRQGSQ